MSNPTAQGRQRSTGRVGLVPAPLGRRLAAGLIDGLLASALTIPYVITSFSGDLTDPPPLHLLILPLAFAIVVLTMHATRGVTPGKLAMGLRTARLETDGVPGWGPILIKTMLPAIAGALTFGLGQLAFLVSILLDKEGRHRGWHDKAAGLIVLDARVSPAPRASSAGPTATADPSAQPTATAGPPAQPMSVPWTPSTDNAPPATPSHQPLPVSSGSASVVQGPEPLSPVASPGPVATGPSAELSGTPPATPPPGPSRVGMQAPPTPTDTPAADGLISVVPGVTRSTVPADQPGVEVEPVVDAESTRLSLRDLATVTLRFDHGVEVPVRGRGVVGRNPDPGTQDVAHVIHVPEDSFSVSKTHLEFGLDGSALWVRDLHSTNGVTVEGPDGQQSAAAGDRVTVAAGTTVRFGTHSFVVVG